jgi:hypothetical protein
LLCRAAVYLPIIGYPGCACNKHTASSFSRSTAASPLYYKLGCRMLLFALCALLFYFCGSRLLLAGILGRRERRWSSCNYQQMDLNSHCKAGLLCQLKHPEAVHPKRDFNVFFFFSLYFFVSISFLVCFLSFSYYFPLSCFLFLHVNCQDNGLLDRSPPWNPELPCSPYWSFVRAMPAAYAYLSSILRPSCYQPGLIRGLSGGLMDLLDPSTSWKTFES